LRVVETELRGGVSETVDRPVGKRGYLLGEFAAKGPAKKWHTGPKVPIYRNISGKASISRIFPEHPIRNLIQGFA